MFWALADENMGFVAETTAATVTMAKVIDAIKGAFQAKQRANNSIQNIIRSTNAQPIDREIKEWVINASNLNEAENKKVPWLDKAYAFISYGGMGDMGLAPLVIPLTVLGGLTITAALAFLYGWKIEKVKSVERLATQERAFKMFEEGKISQEELSRILKIAVPSGTGGFNLDSIKGILGLTAVAGLVAAMSQMNVKTSRA